MRWHDVHCACDYGRQSGSVALLRGLHVRIVAPAPLHCPGPVLALSLLHSVATLKRFSPVSLGSCPSVGIVHFHREPLCFQRISQVVRHWGRRE